MKKMIALVLLVAIAAVLFTGCAKGASSPIAQPAADEGAELKEITGSCTIERVNEDTLRVICTTNLMPTTKVAVTLDSYTGENHGTEKVEISGETFSVDFKADEKWSYPLTASIVCAPSKYGRQLSAVKEAYGTKLQNVTGEYVIWNTESNVIVISSEEFNG